MTTRLHAHDMGNLAFLGGHRRSELGHKGSPIIIERRQNYDKTLIKGQCIVCARWDTTVGAQACENSTALPYHGFATNVLEQKNADALVFPLEGTRHMMRQSYLGLTGANSTAQLRFLKSSAGLDFDTNHNDFTLDDFVTMEPFVQNEVSSGEPDWLTWSWSINSGESDGPINGQYPPPDFGGDDCTVPTAPTQPRPWAFGSKQILANRWLDDPGFTRILDNEMPPACAIMQPFVGGPFIMCLIDLPTMNKELNHNHNCTCCDGSDGSGGTPKHGGFNNWNIYIWAYVQTDPLT